MAHTHEEVKKRAVGELREMAEGLEHEGKAREAHDHALLKSVRREYHRLNHELRASAKRAARH